MADKKLTFKQGRFVAEYLIDLNATQAAIRAGYSPKTAEIIGHENLRKPKIDAAIQKAMNRREKRVEVSQDRVVTELARVAFGDLRGAVTWGPDGVTLVSSKDLTEDEAAAISEVAETVTKDGGSTRIKRHDKIKALELLGKHLGMFSDRSNDGGPGSGFDPTRPLRVEFVTTETSGASKDGTENRPDRLPGE